MIEWVPMEMLPQEVTKCDSSNTVDTGCSLDTLNMLG